MTALTRLTKTPFNEPKIISLASHQSHTTLLISLCSPIEVEGGKCDICYAIVGARKIRHGQQQC
jgi:hypothetical protein